MNNLEIVNRINDVKARIEKLIENGHLEEAKAILSEIESRMPGDPDICSMRAVIYILQGSLEEAEAILREGLQIDSVQYDLLYNLAYIREQQGRYQQAADLYSMAATVACSDEQKQNTDNSLERLRMVDPNIEITEKAKIVFFVKSGMNNFFEDIISGLSEQYWVRKIAVSDLKQIDSGMEWADICWFEWCDELIVYGSKLPLAKQKKIVCRLHRYEAFSDYPSKVIWENVDKLIIVTGHLKELLETNFSGISKKVDIVVIENGVDVDKYSFIKRENGFNIAMVCYIHSRKNPVMALQIIQKLVKVDKRYKLYVAGQFQEQLIKLYWEYQLKRMGIEENVIFEGWQNDINSWLEDKNYLLSTSIHESFGYGIAEAMARGIKPVIHDFLYANEIWSEDLLFNTVDEAVDSIINGQYESERYRDFIEECYSLKKQLLKINDLFKELLSFKNLISRVQDILSGTEKPQELMREDITVLTPCYNRVKMLKEDLDKGLKLGNQPKLIIDDCSTEETQWLSLIEESFYGTKSKLIIKELNSGVAETRRIGLSLIDTKYTTFIDDDNIMVCLDKNKAMHDISDLASDASLVVPRYIINYYNNKMTLGYDRQQFDGMKGADVLRGLAFSGEMMAMLGGGAIGETKWMSEHSLVPMFRSSEDFVMLTRMMASKPEKIIKITEGLVFVRRFPEDCLSLNQDTIKLMLGLFSQAVACYYCLAMGIANNDEILEWMKNRAALIEKIYHFGENFEEIFISYLMGDIDEDYFIQYLISMGFEHFSSLDDLAPELKQLRGIFAGNKTSVSNYDNAAIMNIIDKEKNMMNNVSSYSEICDSLYHVNLVSALSKSSKLFSVVIPTRNSAKYLRYNLMTCINQDFDDYEIVVSDNSTPGNDETLKLVKELDCEKIKYVKPDRELSMTKNFEFAFLNSEGEYVCSLGSDDALLFHALSSLSEILDKEKQVKLLLWERLFYCWPGVADKAQENLFLVGRMYHKDEIHRNYVECESLLRQILQFTGSIYVTLPMIYINSAMHRSNIEKIIKHTGHFIEGRAPDIYTGLINLAVNNELLHIKYPITIGGMSGRSNGAAVDKAGTSEVKGNALSNDFYSLSNKFNEDYRTKYVPRTMDYFDRAMLVTEFFRIAEKKINHWNYNMVNWKNFFTLCCESLKSDDPRFKEKMDDIFHTIKAHHGKELEEWFGENYYYNKDFVGKSDNVAYQQGFFSGINALRVDMSKFGVDNIYDAVKFFKDLYNF